MLKIRELTISNFFANCCIHKLRAEIVVFILPPRCEKDAVRIQGMLNCASDGRRWQFFNEDLANINFDFKGGSIMQPSILQFWHLAAAEDTEST